MSHSPLAFTQGVTSLTGAATIKVSAANGAITLTDVGVTAVNAGNGISVNQTTGSVTVSVNTASSVTYGSLSISNTLTLATNNIPLKFTTTSGNSVSFIQQNDDNFVMYSTNAAGAQRAIWSIYAASNTSPFNVAAPMTAYSVAASASVLTSGTGGIGYSTGAGGTVTQTGAQNSTVSINKLSGQITLLSGLRGSSYVTFSVTNTLVVPTDVIYIHQQYTGIGNQLYQAAVQSVGSGWFSVSVWAPTGNPNEAPVLNFAVIKAVNA
jgi:hypothetical protein